MSEWPHYITDTKKAYTQNAYFVIERKKPNTHKTNDYEFVEMVFDIKERMRWPKQISMRKKNTTINIYTGTVDTTTICWQKMHYRSMIMA